MVSFTLDVVKFLLIYRHLQNTYWFKRGASLSLVPRVEAFALPCQPKRATLKAPRKCIYRLFHKIQSTHRNGHSILKGMYIIHPRGVPVALFLTNSLNLRSSNTSKPKRTVTPFMYMCLPKHPTHKGFQQGLDYAKIIIVLVSTNFLTIFYCFYITIVR